MVIISNRIRLLERQVSQKNNLIYKNPVEPLCYQFILKLLSPIDVKWLNAIVRTQSVLGERAELSQNHLGRRDLSIPGFILD